MENGLSKSVTRLAAISGNPPLMEGAIRSASHMTGTIPTMDKIMAVCLSLSYSRIDSRTLFGITSFVQCFGMDAFGTAMLSINWFYTFIICVVARALMGWFTGLIAKGLGKVFEGKTVGKFNLNDLIATILCPVMNTAFFLGFMAILFGSIEVMGLNVITAVVIPALSINCILEIIACFVVGSAVSIAVKKIVAANKSK